MGCTAACAGAERAAGLGDGDFVAAAGADGFSSSPPTKKLFILPNIPPLSDEVDAYDVRAGAGAGFDSAAAVM